ncbi:hypothetical protein WJX72_009011 [[Myrmecia] bisecta]|uniref:Uncharacterized protein n=1 Tax=[Myrmecia] bisecta TaxID=41462 RepID=A0AAW1Q5A0_9CHLO
MECWRISSDDMSSSEEYLQQWLGFCFGHLAAAGTMPPQVHLDFMGQRSILRLSCFQQASFLRLFSPGRTAFGKTRAEDYLFHALGHLVGHITGPSEGAVGRTPTIELEFTGPACSLQVTGSGVFVSGWKQPEQLA